MKKQYETPALNMELIPFEDILTLSVGGKANDGEPTFGYSDIIGGYYS